MKASRQLRQPPNRTPAESETPRRSLWVNEESFWREITTQALGGIIAASVIAIAIAAAGVIPWPAVLHSLAILGVMVGGLGALFASALLFRLFVTLPVTKRYPASAAWIGLLYLPVFSVVFLGFIYLFVLVTR